MITSKLQLKLSYPALTRGPDSHEYYKLHDQVNIYYIPFIVKIWHYNVKVVEHKKVGHKIIPKFSFLNLINFYPKLIERNASRYRFYAKKVSSDQ